ncbi:diacylglycerol/lipid kinase family protein [Acidaminobacterium chupaoyuni]
MKHLFIINPAAGSRDRKEEIASIVKRTADEENLDYEIFITSRPGHAAEIAKRECQNRPGELLRFYACGGDGTLNEVLAGIAGQPNAQLTHFPKGTGNDFIKVFGERAYEFSSLPLLTQGEIIDMDYIACNCGTAINVFSVGIDARVAQGMRKYRRLPLMGQEGPYLFSTFENILRGLGQSYEIEIDGRDYSGDYSMLFAANGRWYGGGFCPVPQADPTDGVLEILLVKKVSRITAAKVVGAYKQGRYRELPECITHLQAHSLKIRQKNGEYFPVNLDGEIAMTTHAAAELKSAVPFAVPPGVKVARQEQEVPEEE